MSPVFAECYARIYDNIVQLERGYVKLRYWKRKRLSCDAQNRYAVCPFVTRVAERTSPAAEITGITEAPWKGRPAKGSFADEPDFWRISPIWIEGS